MAEGLYRDHKKEILESFHEASKKVSPSFASAFGIKKRTQKVRILTGHKIIITHEEEKGEELAFACAKKSGEIDYDDMNAYFLSKSYAETRKEDTCEFRPVVLIEKGGNYFEVISRPVEVLFSEDIERIEWEKRLSVLADVNKDEMMRKVIPARRNLFQRIVCRICGIR